MHEREATWVPAQPLHRILMGKYHPKNVHFVANDLRVSPLHQSVEQSTVRRRPEFDAVCVVTKVQSGIRQNFPPAIEIGEGFLAVLSNEMFPMWNRRTDHIL